jgi:hypothetical protein
MAEDVTTADDLYGLEPSEFVAARDALARRLRAAGDRAAAADVAKLRRPSTVAWALNRAAREHPELLERALDGGQRLRAATEAAVGGDVAGLREATAVERSASDRFLDEAESNLGRSAATQPKLAATLRAAAVDAEVADALRRGVLTTDHEASGFGFAADFAIGAPPAADARSTKDAARALTQRRRELQGEVSRLEGEVARLSREADQAEATAHAARAAAAAAQTDLDRAQSDLDEAAGSV